MKNFTMTIDVPVASSRFDEGRLIRYKDLEIFEKFLNAPDTFFAKDIGACSGDINCWRLRGLIAPTGNVRKIKVEIVTFKGEKKTIETEVKEWTKTHKAKIFYLEMKLAFEKMTELLDILTY